MGRVKRPQRPSGCPSGFIKRVYHDGYDAGIGLPPRKGGPPRPKTCPRAFVKRVWHDGFEAGEADKPVKADEVALADAVAEAAAIPEKDFVFVPRKGRSAPQGSNLRRQVYNLGTEVAKTAGVNPGIIKSAMSFGESLIPLFLKFIN